MVAAEIEYVCDELKSMLLGKNRKYGNAAIEPLRIFSRADAEEQLNVRIDDKLSRIKNRQFDEDEDVERDLIGYLVLKKVRRNLDNQHLPQPSFDKLEAAVAEGRTEEADKLAVPPEPEMEIDDREVPEPPEAEDPAMIGTGSLRPKPQSAA